jgi:hypothetical protein
MEQSAKDFWIQYEAALGEKVAAHALGRYLGGWDEYEPPLWGLLIAAERSFRFHHFAHVNWLTSWLLRGDTPQEKIIVIPVEKCIGFDFPNMPVPWWKRIFTNPQPLLTVRYRKEAGGEGAIRIETGRDAQSLVDALSLLCGKNGADA